MRIVGGLVLGIMLLGVGGAAHALQATTAAPTVSELEITAAADVRLTVAAGGDMDPKTYVVSAPVGVTCGGAEYRYVTQENRQCWLWVRRNSEVVLTAQSTGGYGSAWTVEWVGCKPIGNGSACVLNPGVETSVAALFTRSVAR
ncbi:hypothetical protein [Caulobacter mirabilis]|uniref:Secreted protein n=1 Tax=Caulobacter mirabilis TaxID=69666 RepID=A0A2D2AWF8_9CAUL|nr:hypothetical protein [Caulobacter mirabilis]ATQ42305.1 hypothetical protein CSW64_07670 [Caulobacter mirabilis]